MFGRFIFLASSSIVLGSWSCGVLGSVVVGGDVGGRVRVRRGLR